MDSYVIFFFTGIYVKRVGLVFVQIAMDERPMEVMQKTLAVIRKADPGI